MAPDMPSDGPAVEIRVCSSYDGMPPAKGRQLHGDVEEGLGPAVGISVTFQVKKVAGAASRQCRRLGWMVRADALRRHLLDVDS